MFSSFYIIGHNSVYDGHTSGREQLRLTSSDVGSGGEDGAVLSWEARAVPLKDMASISLSGSEIKAAGEVRRG